MRFNEKAVCNRFQEAFDDSKDIDTALFSVIVDIGYQLINKNIGGGTTQLFDILKKEVGKYHIAAICEFEEDYSILE